MSHLSNQPAPPWFSPSTSKVVCKSSDSSVTCQPTVASPGELSADALHRSTPGPHVVEVTFTTRRFHPPYTRPAARSRQPQHGVCLASDGPTDVASVGTVSGQVQVAEAVGEGVQHPSRKPSVHACCWHRVHTQAACHSPRPILGSMFSKTRLMSCNAVGQGALDSPAEAASPTGAPAS